MALTQYGQPFFGPQLYRTIRLPFTGDPDWVDPSTVAPPREALLDIRNNLEQAKTIPLATLAFTFAFFNTAGPVALQLAGGSVSAYAFYAVLPHLFGFPYLDPSPQRMVVEKLNTRAGAITPFFVRTIRQYSMGLCVTEVTELVGANELRIAVVDILSQP